MRCRCRPGHFPIDRKSTRLNSSHTEIYTLSLHDALPISITNNGSLPLVPLYTPLIESFAHGDEVPMPTRPFPNRSEEHTSELQSHRDLHSFPTRRSSDLNHKQRITAIGAVVYTID